MGDNLLPAIADDPTQVVTPLSGRRVPDSKPPAEQSVRGGNASRATPPASKNVDSKVATRAVGPEPVAALDPFPQTGEQFQGFELLSELGRGGMGRVFLVRQQALAHRLVVLKVGRHLSRECQKLAKLQHPNIVPVY